MSPYMMRPFPDEGPYRERVKPFNFAMSDNVAPLGHPAGVEPESFHLVAPYEKDARKWLRLTWRDIHSGKRFEVGTGPLTPYWAVRVKSFRDVLETYATHPEPKSAAQDGTECGRATTGVLAPRGIHATSVVYVGKESNRMEDVDNGLIHSWDIVQHMYQKSWRRFKSERTARRITSL